MSAKVIVTASIDGYGPDTSTEISSAIIAAVQQVAGVSSVTVELVEIIPDDETPPNPEG